MNLFTAYLLSMVRKYMWIMRGDYAAFGQLGPTHLRSEGCAFKPSNPQALKPSTLKPSNPQTLKAAKQRLQPFSYQQKRLHGNIVSVDGITGTIISGG